MSATQSENKLIYKEHLDQDSFRLLKIDSIRKMADGTFWIACHLETYTLANHPPYTALSYAWDEFHSHCDGIVPSVILNDRKVAVTANLYQGFLHLLRETTLCRSQYWWIDALCIDQADQNEQTFQVSIMHKIYREADVVQVWLGADFPRETPVVREFLRALLCKFEDCDARQNGSPTYPYSFLSNLNEKNLADAGLPALKASIWKSVISFWDRAWFSRTWVSQEVAVASYVQIHCGDTEFTLHELIAASRFMVFSGLGTGLMMLREGQPWDVIIHGRQVGCNAVRFEQLIVMANGISIGVADDFAEGADRYTGLSSPDNHPCLRSFAVNLAVSRREECTDPKDKVFALLVLMKQMFESFSLPEIPLTIDYRKSLAEIYQEATAWIILNSGCLGFLATVAPDRPPREDLEFCSWIPDFRIIGRRPLRMFHDTEERIICEIPKPKLRPTIDGYRLNMSAKFIGTVADTGDCVRSLLNDGCYELSARCILNCPPIMTKHNNLPRIDVWRRTLCGISAHAVDPCPAQSRTAFHDWLAFYTLRAMARKSRSGEITRGREVLATMSSFDLLAETDDESPRSLPNWAYWRDMTAPNSNDRIASLFAKTPEFTPIEVFGRRLFRMLGQGGMYLGYGPERMEEGDEIWVAAGAPMLHVLRKRPNGSSSEERSFIGEAYMIDIQDVFDEVRDQEWQRLILR